MEHGPWTVTLNEEFYVVWTCDKCGSQVGFWKPGNPTGSFPTATEYEHPEDIHIYVGHECINET